MRTRVKPYCNRTRSTRRRVIRHPAKQAAEKCNKTRKKLPSGAEMPFLIRLQLRHGRTGHGKMPRADLPILERAAVNAGRGKPRPYKGLADERHG